MPRPPPTVGEVIRRHAVTLHTYYRWKGKFAGMHVSEARRLEELEDENRLKRFVADQTLNIHGHAAGLAASSMQERLRVVNQRGTFGLMSASLSSLWAVRSDGGSMLNVMPLSSRLARVRLPS